MLVGVAVTSLVSVNVAVVVFTVESETVAFSESESVCERNGWEGLSDCVPVLLGENEKVEEIDCDAVRVVVDERACRETESE